MKIEFALHYLLNSENMEENFYIAVSKSNRYFT